MNLISLVWVPFLLAVGLLIVTTVIALVVQLVRYPFLGRFAFLYDKDSETGKRLNLRVVIVGWGSLLLGFGFSAWSLFRFAQLINGMFADLSEITILEKLMASTLPFIYVLIPYHLMRFSTAMVFLAAPQDYARIHQHNPNPLGWGYTSQIGKEYSDPSFSGFWNSVDTAMTLLILFFTPSAFKWVLGSVIAEQQLWAVLFLGTLILLGSFALGIRSDRAAWASGNIADLLLLLGKLAVVMVLFVLISTLAEIDLVEIALFTVFALWIAFAAAWGQR